MQPRRICVPDASPEASQPEYRYPGKSSLVSARLFDGFFQWRSRNLAGPNLELTALHNFPAGIGFEFKNNPTGSGRDLKLLSGRYARGPAQVPGENNAV